MVSWCEGADEYNRKKCQVSIIVCTYNSKWEKLEKTLYMAINQKQILAEVIIADDGSSIFDKAGILDFFQKNNFHNYIILDNENNVGTVRNMLAALKEASGEYSFITSPGDVIYDEMVMADFYNYAKHNNLETLFGRTAFYSCDGEPQVHKVINAPEKLWVYKKNIPLIFQKISVLEGSKILGASFFRKTEKAIEIFEQILPFTVYVEDTSSTLLMSASNTKITFFDRMIVWYEYGTGISTNGNDKWGRIVRTEIERVREFIYLNYSGDKVVKYFIDKSRTKTKLCKVLNMFIKHPYLLCLNLVIKMSRTNYTGGDKRALSRMLKKTGSL